MERKKAVEIVAYNRLQAKTIGVMIWPVMLIGGIIAAIIWKWYAFFFMFLIGILFSVCYSIYQTKRIERITGLNKHEQFIAFTESLVARSDR